MSRLRDFFVCSGLSVLGIVLGLALFEYYLYSNKDRFHFYGWIKNNINSEKIASCKALKSHHKIGLFGDSFVEYYLGSEDNISRKLEDRLGVAVCNFGLSGTGIDTYFARFKEAVDQDSGLRSAVFYFYEGNDFFLVEDISTVERSPEPVDRVMGAVFSFLKSFRSLNFIWRAVIKKHFAEGEIDLAEVLRVFKGTEFSASESVILSRLSAMDEDLLRDFGTDQLNVALLHVSLNVPDYFVYLNSQRNLASVHGKISSYIKEINTMAAKAKMDVKFVIIPHDFYLDTRNKRYWVDVFQFDDYEFLGKTIVSKALEEGFSNVYYADILTGDDYIPLDGHLLPVGNEKLADFTAGLFDRSSSRDE